MASKPVYFFILVIVLLQIREAFGQEVLPRRTSEPVVLTGAALSDFEGKDIDAIVAFSYNSEQGWISVPVQVDEKDSVTGSRIYGDIRPEACFNETWCSDLHLLKILTYTDEHSFTGPDSNPAFDADDELVFMIKDAGAKVTAGEVPGGVVENSGLEVEIIDPIDNSVGYIYLFLLDAQSNASRSKNIRSYVDYNFNLISGDYRRSFSRERGPNPEKSIVSTAYYETAFSDRWVRDVLRIKADGAKPVDLLDRQKVLFAPGVCERHEITFSYGEGAFIVNKSGPVRAIRSYMGANSGPLTQREHIFYEQQEVVNTWLRVHPIQGIMDFNDYSVEAAGMVYSNNNNKSGAEVDGNRDRLVEGKLDWELLTGDQGTLLIQHTYQVQLSSQGVSSYYLDDKNPQDSQCTGDDFAIGSSGIIIKSPIANTDIRVNAQAPDFKLTRINYFSGPNPPKNLPEIRSQNKSNPVQVSLKKFGVSDKNLKVYPNPFADALFIEMEGSFGVNEVMMWNMLGKLLKKETFSKAKKIKIETGELPAGVYMIRISDDSGEQKKMKLVKQYR